MTVRDPETMLPAYKTGNGIAMLSNRISHFYDFRGASMTIDVGCSTGLVALHQACRNLQLGESDISIVGAAITLLSPDMFIALGLAGCAFPLNYRSMLGTTHANSYLVFLVLKVNASHGMTGLRGMVEEKAWPVLC